MTVLPKKLRRALAAIRHAFAQSPAMLAVADKIEADFKAAYVKGYADGFAMGLQDGYADGLDAEAEAAESRAAKAEALALKLTEDYP